MFSDRPRDFYHFIAVGCFQSGCRKGSALCLMHLPLFIFFWKTFKMEIMESLWPLSFASPGCHVWCLSVPCISCKGALDRRAWWNSWGELTWPMAAGPCRWRCTVLIFFLLGLLAATHFHFLGDPLFHKGLQNGALSCLSFLLHLLAEIFPNFFGGPHIIKN